LHRCQTLRLRRAKQQTVFPLLHTVKFLRYNHNVWKKCVRFCQPALSVDRAVHRKFFPWHLTMDCMVSQDSGKKRKRCPVRPLQKVEKGEAVQRIRGSPSHLLEKSEHMETSVAPLAYAICMASRTYGGTKKEATAKKSQHMETSMAPLAYAICMASRTYGGTKKEATAKHGNS